LPGRGARGLGGRVSRPPCEPIRAFLLRRLLHAVFVVWGVVTVVFFLVRLTGDPTLFLVDPSATQEEIAHTRTLLGLDRPLLTQYVDALLAMPRGDFGISIREKRPAMRMVLEHFWPATVELAAAALLLSTALAVPLGVVSATRRGRFADHASRIASLFLQSMPSFWLGIMLILLFAVALGGLLPAYGSGTLRHLILPAIALAAAPLAQNVRLVRAGMLEVLGQDYVRTARAKGVGERSVIYRHALRNAALPVITVTGLSLGFMLSGTIIIETVFAWPGLGRLIVQAVPGRDFPVIQAGVFLFAVVFVAINLIVDVLYSVVDPRVRLT
jgi:peptide/nickel transport system permease protein